MPWLHVALLCCLLAFRRRSFIHACRLPCVVLSAKGHEWFLLIRNELGVCLGYYIPYNLFMRSGRPQALKSAMFASFTFFIQTVSLLGKDTGYFMGKDYMTQEGDKEMKKKMAYYADMFGKFFSVSLQASVEPVVEVDAETGERLLKPHEICPLHLDAYKQFYKGALFKSALILIGVTLWYQGIYHAFVFTRVQYYVCYFFKTISGEKNNVLFEPFTSKHASFYQDRLGTNIGKTPKNCVFLRRPPLR